MNSPDDLLPHQTLALAYAKADLRAQFETALLLENRLGAVLRGASEPMIAQLKLAWWRDRFAQSPDEWPKGEPLLARLSGWEGTVRLVALVDGYEALLGDALGPASARSFASGRGRLWAVTAQAAGLEQAAGEAARAGALVAYADLAANVASAEERAVVVATATEVRPPRSLPRGLRPLQVLAGLADRALARGGVDPASGAGAYLRAIRVGLLGR
ncbi:hypothetical protein VCJ71_02175 [Alteriqipengyuania sp. WL0013]|uniref:hypothetical protein n=1 Tax=Alteriqipengyuania sp. WL0013 TaxID=3110773 RepID=UPI002C4975B8|nr:hypothetical protein [Alteriqipengyuania sp. WL0013]MEB3414866.1 hypothetical protein [Alteriqipengyuania sp. WL0013]